MKYAILVRESKEDFALRNDSPEGTRYRAGWTAYTAALQQAGVLVGGAGLQAPETGTIVRVKGDKREVQDGPFPDGKEQLGGFYLLEVPNIDAALEWAVRVPVTERGSVEVRPLLPM
ncbi:YciI family protein [Rhizobium sp. RAF56]|jgi:hypothetical protein|uniref:YciI family protein n=1 Tax=Rhizobium sp. RAF56 TaxID=3233062 RepID=UPI003F9D3C36